MRAYVCQCVSGPFYGYPGLINPQKSKYPSISLLSYLDPTSTKHSLCTACRTWQISKQMTSIFNLLGGFPEANFGMERASCRTAIMAMFIFEEDLSSDRWLYQSSGCSQSLSLNQSAQCCNERTSKHGREATDSRWGPKNCFCQVSETVWKDMGRKGCRETLETILSLVRAAEKRSRGKGCSLKRRFLDVQYLQVKRKEQMWKRRQYQK